MRTEITSWELLLQVQLDITLLFSSSDASCSAESGLNSATNMTPKTKNTPVTVLHTEGYRARFSCGRGRYEKERGNVPKADSTSFPVLESFSRRGETCLDGYEGDGSNLDWWKRRRDEVSESVRCVRGERGRKGERTNERR